MNMFDEAYEETPDLLDMGVEEEIIDPELELEMSSVFSDPSTDFDTMIAGTTNMQAGSEPVPIVDVNDAIEGNYPVSSMDSVDTTSPDIGMDSQMSLDSSAGNMMGLSSYDSAFDQTPVTGALNGLLGQFGLEQEPMPKDPMLGMMEQKQKDAAELGPGVYPIKSELMPMAVEVLSESFKSLNESGIILAHQDRLAYASAIMKENTAFPSTQKAKFLNAFMKNGKIIPELLPPDWYLSRGAMLKKQKQEELMAAKADQYNAEIDNQKAREGAEQDVRAQQAQNMNSQNMRPPIG